MPYSIEEHRHKFAAWAASRTASVKGCRFTVETGRALLEAAGLRELSNTPAHLPQNIDQNHKTWRSKIIEIGKSQYGMNISHGVAAKLINVYQKALLVCGGYQTHEKVKALHPPIDSLLLDKLAENNVGALKKTWKHYAKIRWSKFTSDDYETVIESVRKVVSSEQGMWAIEEYWQGYQ